MTSPKNVTHKEAGEMDAQEFAAACAARSGIRPPKDPREEVAYIVASTFVTAGQAFADRDLIERFAVDFLLGRGALLPGIRERIERALGRPIGVEEPKPFDVDALLKEQAERRRAAFE